MAKIKISDLDAAAALDGTELVEVTQDGASVQTTTQDIADLGGASYLKYVALLTQTGTDAPVATVLENTLGGTVVWTYDSQGYYVGTLAGAFTVNKTTLLIANNTSVSDAYSVARIDANSIGVESGTAAPTNEDDKLNGTFVEIRVYP